MGYVALLRGTDSRISHIYQEGDGSVEEIATLWNSIDVVKIWTFLALWRLL